MFLKDPLLELQLFQFRQKEMEAAAARERLLRSAPRSSNGLARGLLRSLGKLLVAIGERLREDFEEPARGAAAKEV